jgi:hypothetical protein
VTRDAGLPPCDPRATIAKLSGIPQPDLGWFARAIAFLTTPFKFLGISGWSDTGCAGEGQGRLVRDARHSTDGFWTIDVALEGFAVGDVDAPYDRFLRVECEPGTEAHRVCAARRPAAGKVVWFTGPLVVDTDGPFLESHPDLEFKIVEERSRESRVTGRGSGPASTAGPPVILSEAKDLLGS